MESQNPCCIQWKTKFLKIERSRNALREGVKILNEQIDRLQSENADFKKECDEERTRINVLEEEKQKETSLRISMEKEITALKSEISTKSELALGRADLDIEANLLRTCISEREVEINHLKQFLDGEKMKVESERKNSAELQKHLEFEKTKADEASKMANAAAREAEEHRIQIETLKNELEKTNLKWEEVNRKLEAEKQNVIKEYNGSDEKRVKEEELRSNRLQKQLEEEKLKVEKLQLEMQEIMCSKKPADSSELDEVKKKLVAEKKKVGREKKRVEEEKARVIEQRRLAEANEKRVAEEKCRADKLLVQLEEEKQNIGKLQREIQELLLSHEAANSSQLNELKKNLEEERKKVAHLQSHVEEANVSVQEQRRIAEANEKKVAEEKCRADKLSMQLEEEKQKIEKCQREMEDLMLSHKAVNSFELDELKKKLEVEKNKVSQVQMHVEEEKANVMEQRRTAEANEKKVAEERRRADKLLMQLEEEKQKFEKCQMEMQDVLLSHKAVNTSELDELKRNLEEEKNNIAQAQRHLEEERASVMEQRRVAELNKKMCLEEKCRADKLLVQLEEEKQKVQKLQKEEEEKANVMEQRRIAEVNKNMWSEEKCRTDKLLLQLEEEKQKVQKLHWEISSQKSINTSEVAEVYRILEAEKKKVESERKRADVEMSKKEEQKRRAEVGIKNAIEEKARADKLFEELEYNKETIDKLEKELQRVNNLLEVERKEVARDNTRADMLKLSSDEQANEMRAMAKCRGDHLSSELQIARQKIQDMEHKLQGVNLCRSSPSFVMNEQAARINLLQEQIKFEKKRVKHTKEVGKLEKGRNRVLQQELQRLKLDFQCLLDHLGMLSDNFGARSGVTNLSKKLGQSQINFCGDKELRMSNLSSRDASCLLKSNMHVGQAGLCVESTSASFSDEQLMGSQGRVTGPLTMTQGFSAENTNQQVTTLKCLNQCCKQKNGDKAGIIDEHIIRGSVETETGTAKKRKKIVDEFESIKCMHFESKRIFQDAEKKLSSLQNTLLGPMMNEKIAKENLLLPNNNPNLCANVDGSGKKRKPLCEPEVLQLAGDSNEQISGDKNMAPSVKEMQKTSQNAEKKLSSLQNTLLRPIMNEEIAMENLLLPISNSNLCANVCGSGKKRKPLREPEVLQQAGDSNEQILGDNKTVAPSAKETMQNSLPLAVLERDGLKDNLDALTSFEQLINGDYMKLLDLDNAVAEECFRMAMERPLSPIPPEFDLHDFGQSIGIQNLAVPVPGKYEAAYQHAFSVLNKNQIYFVLFSDMDVGSMTRIYGATRTCISHCLFIQTNWSMQDMLEALMLENDLRPREKACVLFSLMLINFSAVSFGKLVNFHSQEQVDSFSAHIHTVLSNFDVRVLCAKICDLRELLALSEDLILHKKILSNSDVTCESLEGCGSSIEIMHEEELIVLWPKMASTTQVVAGSIVLGCICKAVGHIGFLCEVSLKVLQMGRSDYSIVLTILHAFANICGHEYISNSNYSLVMKVVKSVVTFMEDSLAKNASNVLQTGQCVSCTFSEGSVSLDDVSLELLAELQKHIVSRNPVALANSSNSEALSCFLGDALSSLELIASIMCWDWVCNNFVPKLFEVFESSEQGNRVVSTALVVLLGFIGRLGVESHGYNDSGVEVIKQHLLGLLRPSAVSKRDATLSMAVVYELIGLYPKGHEMFQMGNYVDVPSEDCNSSSASFSTVSKFLSFLSSEQITSLSGLITPA